MPVTTGGGAITVSGQGGNIMTVPGCTVEQEVDAG
jgi:hypothetical protein